MKRHFLAVLTAALVLVGSPAVAAPFPPQLPTAEQLAQLRAQMDASLVKVRAAQAELDAVVAAYEVASDRHTVLAGQVIEMQRKEAALQAELGAAQGALDSRAASSYRSERLGLLGVLLSATTYREFAAAFTLVKSVIERDARAIDRLGELRADAARVKSELETRKAEEQKQLAELSRQQKQMNRSLAAVGKEYESVRSELERRKSGFAFPVKAPYSYSSTWGAPRMEGTRYYHRHEGTDIFALQGTPVVAVVDGVIENMGTATLGGIKLWIRSPGDGWSYYYAHLSGYAAGMTNGKRVSKGEIVGYVGNTGNARGTPPHLHFETHVPSGAPTDPYPILKRADPISR